MDHWIMRGHSQALQAQEVLWEATGKQHNGFPNSGLMLITKMHFSLAQSGVTRQAYLQHSQGKLQFFTFGYAKEKATGKVISVLCYKNAYV